MVKVIKAETIEKDDDLAILKKVISLPNNFCFSTPTRSIKSSMQKDSLRSDSIINEVVKRVDINFLESLEEGATSRVTREIRASCLTNKLNLVIFDLIFDTVPNETLIRTLAQQIYSSSDICIFLPTVRKALFSEIPQFRKTPKFSDRKFGKYLDMMETIINDIIEVGNNKPFIGTIPFIPIKYARQIINLYYQKGITSFAIDANTRDVLSNEADLRDILSEINRKIRLPDAFIYACNLGYPRYDDLVARADDFLSIFAYIDVMGGTFKIKGFSNKPPRKKKFSKNEYRYEIVQSHYPPRNELEVFNHREQLAEAHKVKQLLGEENIKQYINEKPAVDRLTMKKLESIASNVRIS